MIFAISASSIISDLNPIHDLGAAASASASAIGHATWNAIAAGISAAIMTAIKGLISGLVHMIIAMIEHTSPQFAKTDYNPIQPALFSPVWHVMVFVGITCAVLIMFVGISASIIRGETGVLVKQIVFGLIAVLAMASPVPPLIAQAIFSTIQLFSKFILDAALAGSGHVGFFTSTSNSAIVAKDSVAIFSASNPEISLAFVALIGILTAMAAATVWFELLAREAIAYLIMGLFPLALAGLFYKGSSRWLRRAVEGLIAVALGQIIIAILFAFAVSSLLLAGQNMSLTDFGLFAVFMSLAAVGLPIAMRVAPMALEFGEAAFHASSLAGSARGAVAAHTTGPVKSAISQRLHAPLMNRISGKDGGGSGGGTKPWNSLAQRVSLAGDVAADIEQGQSTPADRGKMPMGNTPPLPKKGESGGNSKGQSGSKSGGTNDTPSDLPPKPQNKRKYPPPDPPTTPVKG